MQNVDRDTGEVFDRKQLPLFEGYEIQIVEEKLKACDLARYMSDKRPAPKLYEKRYYVVEARAINISHGDKDELLTKIAKFEAESVKEVDELTGARLVMGL